MSNHFGTLCLKGLKTEKLSSDNNISCINATNVPPANVCNWHKRESSLELEYENTNYNEILSENTKNVKKTKILETFLCNRITITVALEAYLEPSET